MQLEEVSIEQALYKIWNIQCYKLKNKTTFENWIYL